MGAVLVTGCSSGIGRETALALVRAGFPVWASARDAGRLAELERAGCRVLELDVTDERSRIEAVRRVEAEHGAIGVLINNAGHGGGGPVEEVPLGLVRDVFETNVFAPVRMCQLVLPGMRERRGGVIVNPGSAAGLVTPPTGCPMRSARRPGLPRWRGGCSAIAAGTRSCAAWCPSRLRVDPAAQPSSRVSPR